MKSADTGAVREFNAALTLRALFDSDAPLTKTRLHEITGLSRRTLDFILADQLATGWAREAVVASPTAGAGRPPRGYVFHAANTLIAGVHIDHHEVRAVVADTRGEELGECRRSVANWANPRLTLAEAAAALHAAADDGGVSIDAVRAAGIAVGGVVDGTGRIISTYEGPGWAGVDVAGAFASHIDGAVIVDNDVNLAAIAEHWKGAAADQSSFVWLLAGSRTRAGIVIDGRAFRGARSAAGESVDGDGFNTREMRLNEIGGLSSPVAAEREAATLVLRRAESGDSAALRIVDDFASSASVLVRALTWVVDPPLVVLGGGIERAAALLVPRIEAAFAERALPPIEIRPSALGWDAPLLGALRVAQEHAKGVIFG
ncbi:ROK family protein [Galbitalea sp. SE-J8]|uniref:ROK family protein n=1 Tax=Galbitalea sp. SE-J8 TaxID=3054952 RepID=UPI00259C75B9|nr:ROK family protein [Galbitalea sp. SE-J8]MDM4762229.1 ROK family protein [Galbitalea sp. SE-J8]